ncbi:MAG: DUF2269 family protein [Chloroflexi bacterium]|nr:MAG: DUF2269 family protein [Chloroflexota bacterium]
MTAVGSNITYGVWNVRAQSNPAQLGFALKGIKFIDDRIANPAYGVLVVTGLLLVFVNRWPVGSLWIVLALILFAALAVLAFRVYSPLLRNQIKLVDAGDTTSPEFERLSRRSAMVGPILGLLAVLILILMVFKPTL